ncbi:MAG: tail fiber protein [Ferruginibacter sp.]
MSEIQIFGFDWAPKYWALCQGQLLPIAQNQALFSLLGTVYGGDGRTTFGLPDLRGRSANSVGKALSGNNYDLGQKGGEENHTLTQGEMPAHIHFMLGSKTVADMPNPDGNMLASGGTAALYINASDGTQMAGNAIGIGGGNQPHPNLQPYLAMNYSICTQGIFPSRN